MNPTLKGCAVLTGLLLTPPTYAEVCLVPLKTVNIGSTSAPVYKIGINVGLGGGTPKLYEFDTGGPGFWAAYNKNLKPASQWWGDNHLIAEGAMSIQYTSGNEYTANLVGTQIELFDPTEKGGKSPLCTTGTVQISQITSFNNSKSANSVVKQWNTRLAHGKAPLYKHFWGDFGAALHPTMSATVEQGVYTVLNQFQTGAEHNGFIVHIGNLSKSQYKQQRPYVQIGLNTTDINSFPYQFQMNALCSSSGPDSPSCPLWSTFSNTTVNTFAEAQFNADVTVNGRAGSPHAELLPSMGIIIDSGATLANIYQNPNCVTNCYVSKSFIADPRPEPGISPTLYKGLFVNGYSATISVASQKEATFRTTLTQSSKPLNSIINANYSANKAGSGKGGVMNTGVLFYSNWDVMYDVTAGVIGFRPAMQ